MFKINEPNFFKDPWATHFKKYSDSKPFLKYKVIIDKNNYYHVMNPKIIKELFKNE